MKRKMMGGLAVLSLVFLLAGCGQASTGSSAAGTQPGSARSSSGKKYTIGVSMYSLTNPYFAAMKDSFVTNGAKYGVTVNVEASNGDEATQLSQIEGFIQQRVNAVAIVPQDSNSIVTAVKALNEAHIPVFFIDANADMNVMKQDGATEVEAVESDNYQGGVQVGKEVVAYLGSKPQADIGIVNFPTASSTQARDAGFLSVIKKYPGIKVVSTLNGNVSPVTGLQVGSEMLQGHPNMTLIFSDTGPAALGVMQAIQSQHKQGKVALFGFSSARPNIKAIQDNSIYKAGVRQQPAVEAQIEVENMYKYFNHKSVPPQVLVPVPAVTKQNAQASYAASFG
ncbi:D-ribose-binding periplasmic protein precursor [Peptococcaceae bacterium CEB3]|nr:D-ribose-binding periplasmic protein precursor [Peptococcaceae bacterium CEB3]